MNSPNDQHSQPPPGEWRQSGPSQYESWQSAAGWAPVAGEYRPNEDERTWAIFTHLGTLVLGFIAPLVVMVTKGEQSPYVKDQSKEALNFVLNLYGWLLIIVVFYVGSMLVPLLPLLVLPLFLSVIVLMYVMPILAAVAVSQPRWYRYPCIYRIVR